MAMLALLWCLTHLSAIMPVPLRNQYGNSGWWECEKFPVLCKLWNFLVHSSLSFLRTFSLPSHVESHHVQAQIGIQWPKGNFLQISLVLFHLIFSSPVLYSTNSSCFNLPEVWALFLQPYKTTGLVLFLLFAMYSPGIASKQKAGVIVALVSFASFQILRITVLLCLLSNVWQSHFICLAQFSSCSQYDITSPWQFLLQGQMWKTRSASLHASKEPNVLIQNQLDPLFQELKMHSYRTS